LASLILTSLLNSFMSTAHNTQNKGSISIYGSSNVNKFVLTNSMMPISLRACNYCKDTNALKTKVYWVQIPIKDFQTDNPQVYKDFLNITKSRQYPNISIGITLEMLHKIVAGVSSLVVPAEVSMAGTAQTYHIRCQIQRTAPQVLTVSGYQTMKLTDFNISPPEKLFGLVKVNNEINVNFGFVIAII